MRTGHSHTPTAQTVIGAAFVLVMALLLVLVLLLLLDRFGWLQLNISGRFWPMALIGAGLFAAFRLAPRSRAHAPHGAFRPFAGTGLSSVMAGFLDAGPAARPALTLAQEMARVRDILAGEKARLGARLVTEEALEKGALACLVPPMIVGPLVAHAVRHGIGRLADGGLVLVAAWRDGARLTITVSNAVPAHAPQTWRWRIALAGARRRLARSHPGRSLLAWKCEGDTFTVEIHLPAQLAGQRG